LSRPLFGAGDERDSNSHSRRTVSPEAPRIGAAFYANYVGLGADKLWETCEKIARYARSIVYTLFMKAC
jgi:hypothetical protein